MKKYLILLMIAIPLVTQAAWWNPFSWNKKPVKIVATSTVTNVVSTTSKIAVNFANYPKNKAVEKNLNDIEKTCVSTFNSAASDIEDINHRTDRSFKMISDKEREFRNKAKLIKSLSSDEWGDNLSKLVNGFADQMNTLVLRLNKMTSDGQTYADQYRSAGKQFVAEGKCKDVNDLREVTANIIDQLKNYNNNYSDAGKAVIDKYISYLDQQQSIIDSIGISLDNTTRQVNTAHQSFQLYEIKSEIQKINAIKNQPIPSTIINRQIGNYYRCTVRNDGLGYYSYECY
jgi:hypothetical protein